MASASLERYAQRLRLLNASQIPPRPTVRKTRGDVYKRQLLAHVVGAGKTWTMAAAVMELSLIHIFARLLKLVSDNQAASPEIGGFQFICEIAAEIRSVKKLSEMGGIVATPDTSSGSGHPVVLKTQSLVDKYPLSYMELRGQVLLQRPGAKPAKVDQIIRDCKVKEDTRLCLLYTSRCV